MAAALSLWAVPSRDDADVYANTIRALAADAGTKPFAPHLTLTSAPDRSGARAAISDVTARFAPFMVDLIRFEDSAEQFRCITAAAAKEGPLIALHAATLSALGEETKPYEPHLSLAYGELPAATRLTLRSTLSPSLLRPITVDAVHAVDTSAADYSEWTVVETWPLSPQT